MSSVIIPPEPSQDYPPAIWMPADETNFRRGRPQPGYSLIVIHCTDGHERAQGTAEMWQAPGHKSSAHFVISNDGSTVIQAVSLKDTAWHCHDRNSIAAGVEHCARTPGEWSLTDPGLLPSQAQYLASARLVAWLCRRAGLPATRDVIRGHAEVDQKTGHTLCPEGCGWNWDRYMTLVGAAYAEWDNAS